MPNPTSHPPQTEIPLDEPVFSVSELNAEAKAALENGIGLCWVTGEISNFYHHRSGHMYFSLKDGQSQVRCAMFSRANRMLKFPPRDGLQILLHGRASVYTARGEFQLIVEHMEPAGEGLLRRQFEALKAKLAAEGLFAADEKRPLPALPACIGLVTSPGGAAVRDILHVLGRRFPAIPVVIYPVQVQGETAKKEIARAIDTAGQRAECDLLIVGRGGGSLEDLWAFNEEIVARAIHACPLPVISAVGHEVDFTIADLVADVRAPTPSAAAELAVPDRREWLDRNQALGARAAHAMQVRLHRRRDRWTELAGRLQRRNPVLILEQIEQRLDDLSLRAGRALRQALATVRLHLDHATARLRAAHPGPLIRAQRQDLAAVEQRLATAIRSAIVDDQRRLEVFAARLQSASPLVTLQRGYAVIETSDGRLVRGTQDIKVDDGIVGRLADGRFRAVVKKILPP